VILQFLVEDAVGRRRIGDLFVPPRVTWLGSSNAPDNDPRDLPNVAAPGYAGMPASLRSDGVPVYPRMPFGIIPDFGCAGIPVDPTAFSVRPVQVDQFAGDVFFVSQLKKLRHP
jgi:hypothetical protein